MLIPFTPHFLRWVRLQIKFDQIEEMNHINQMMKSIKHKGRENPESSRVGTAEEPPYQSKDGPGIASNEFKLLVEQLGQTLLRPLLRSQHMLTTSLASIIESCYSASSERKLLCISWCVLFCVTVVIALYRAIRIVCLHDVSMMYTCLESAHGVVGGSSGQRTWHTWRPYPMNRHKSNPKQISCTKLPAPLLYKSYGGWGDHDSY
jgi:hypothetical protein